ncbi:MAG TPA: hypothetical protein VGC54_02415 [Planctomycetota bacterium]
MSNSPRFIPVAALLAAGILSTVATAQQAAAQHSPPVGRSVIAPGGGAAPAAPTGFNRNAASGETVGGWFLQPPDAAAQVAGGSGSPWGWLNSTNAAVSVNDAFSGAGMVEDGFANSLAGVVVEVFFAGGVTNGPGADVVMLDAQFDSGTYFISADHDGFGTEATVTPAVNTGEVRAYYYEHNAGGPFTATVYGGELDLSAIGVGAGASVTRIRFRMESSSCDPIGLGAIVPDFSLTITGPCPGSVTVDVSGATPSGSVAFATALGTGSFVIPGGFPCAGTVLGLSSAGITHRTTRTADAAGNISFPATAPAGACGRLFVQAIDLTTCATTNVVAL